MPRRVVTQEVEETSLSEPVAREGSYRPSNYFRVANIVYIIFGLLELLLLFRFVFLLLGANQANGFVNFIYALSQPFVAPFYGIFGQASYSSATLDPATIIAMVVYAIVAWVIVRIVAATANRPADPV